MARRDAKLPAADWRAVRDRLRGVDFAGLFIEELGWDPLPRALPLEVEVGPAGGAEGPNERATFRLSPIAEKRGFVAYRCPPGQNGEIPSRSARDAIDRRVAKDAYEHLVVYTDADEGEQVWQWARREPGRPAARREHRLSRDAGGEALARRIAGLAVSLKEEEDLTIVEVSGRVRAAFDVEPVTKKFYEGFQKQHAAFLGFIEGIASQGDREWYASIMLNRLMFVYFVEKKGFLDNGDTRYLRNRMEALRNRGAGDRFLTFYRHFLVRLFHDGLSREKDLRDPELDELLGDVPYLNGGLFEPHELEREYPDLRIPDEAFERLFDFFDGYQWHLDERPLREGNEINPDVLGYIFEKYVNQKQMGAYYTKEDVTGYITQNTIIPHLFDTAQKECAIAFEPDRAMWNLLVENPERYVYGAMKKGVVDNGWSLSLPAEIQTGVNDVSQRAGWNRPADDDYALTTETWREHVDRRERCEDLRERLALGEVTAIDNFVALNLDTRQFAQDAIENCEGPDLLRAFYRGIQNVSVLDPTCGSGAFLFAALNVLEPLYEACLERMERFRDEDPSGRAYTDFREILADVDGHPNRRYFVLKSIVVRNLYGVDIMEEAVEIARLRLFLKLMAQIENAGEIEPLPDIDFNLRVGNTLVGFASMDQLRKTPVRKLDFELFIQKIEHESKAAADAFGRFRRMQTEVPGTTDSEEFADAKTALRERLRKLNAELDRYLAAEYGVEPNDEGAFAAWHEAHRPFHWLVEFFGIIKDGGFDVIVGNPPWKEYSAVKRLYTVKGYATEKSGNLYALCTERSLDLCADGGQLSFIVQLPLMSSRRMATTRELLRRRSDALTIVPFDDRPGKLFEGLQHCRSVIFKSRVGDAHDAPLVFASKYQRWPTAARDSLFAQLELTETTDEAIYPQRFAKFANELQSSIFAKVKTNSDQALASALTRNRSDRFVFYQEAMQYWVKAAIGLPHYVRNGEVGAPAHGRYLSFQNPEHAEVAYALLNSSLFYCYFVAFGDCFHLSQELVSTFPVPSILLDDEDLSTLGGWLMEDLNDNAGEETIQTRDGHTISYAEFYGWKSKHIIDEIDRVLAEHYGFTDEELDFIVNYDIKYRMGSEAAE